MAYIHQLQAFLAAFNLHFQNLADIWSIKFLINNPRIKGRPFLGL